MGNSSGRPTEADERILTLEEIALGKKTDKLSHHSYLPLYTRLFAPFRDRPEPILEVGAWYGGSLLMWAEYFSCNPIVGCETNRVPLPEDADRRIRIVHGDAYTQYTRTFLETLGPYSITIDDGPHTLESQIYFCEHYPKMLVADGIAIVEDIQVPHHLVELAGAVPKGFQSAAVDLRHVKDRYDDLALLIWRG